MRVEMLIRQIRKEKNISLNELSNMTGLSKGNLSMMERGEVDPKITSVIKIAIALKCDVSELYKIHF